MKLTKQEAQKLVKASKDDDLDLDHITELDEGAADIIAKFKGGNLYLNGLPDITEHTASRLVKLSGARRAIHLSGLKTISASAATQLAKFDGRMLVLDGLTKIDHEAAIQLSKLYGIEVELHLNGLENLPPEIAAELAKFEGFSLELNGIREMSPSQAVELSNSKASLCLDGLEEISESVTVELEKFKAKTISLDGLKELSQETAIRLATWSSNIDPKDYFPLNLTPRARKCLQRNDGSYVGCGHGCLSLNGLKRLNKGVTDAFAQFKGEAISLSGLEELDDEEARILARYATGGLYEGRFGRAEGSLRLDGLKTLSDRAAQALVKFEGSLCLDGLQTVSDKAAEALAKIDGLSLWDMSEKVQSQVEKFKEDEPEEDDDWEGEEDDDEGELTEAQQMSGAFIEALREGNLAEAKKLRKQGARVGPDEDNQVLAFTAAYCEETGWIPYSEQLDPDRLPRIVGLKQVLKACGPLYSCSALTSSGERPLGYARAAVEDRVLSWTDYGFGLVGDQVSNIDERYYTAKPLTRFKDAIIAGPLDEEHVKDDLLLVGTELGLSTGVPRPEPNWKKFGLSPEKPNWVRFGELFLENQIGYHRMNWCSNCASHREQAELLFSFYQICDEKGVESAELEMARAYGRETIGEKREIYKKARALAGSTPEIKERINLLLLYARSQNAPIVEEAKGKDKKAKARKKIKGLQEEVQKIKQKTTEPKIALALCEAMEMYLDRMLGRRTEQQTLSALAKHFRQAEWVYESLSIEVMCMPLQNEYYWEANESGDSGQALTALEGGACPSFVNGAVLRAMVREGGECEVKWLLEHGASAKGFGLPDGVLVPLATAVNRNNKELVALFLEHGADPNEPSHYDGQTPLEMAEESEDAEILRMLKKAAS